jgi:hypothetical protein
MTTKASTRAPLGLAILGTLAAVAALILFGRLAVFMADPTRTSFSFLPSSQWEVRHSCLTAYFVAAKAVDETADIYDNALYSAPDDDPKLPRKPLMMGPFRVDVYEYPPSFLFLPRALLFVTHDFVRYRLLWFFVMTGMVLFAMVLIARALGVPAGRRALLLMPLVWASLPMLSTVQKGNIQPVTIALSMLAMLLFARRRNAAGGLLLAYAVASKLYPGLLVAYLIAARRWRAVAWTAVFGVALFAGSLLDIGWAPYAAFLHHLPGILSGEAFPAFRNPMATALNLSVPGLVLKLKLFGVPGMGFPAARLVGWIYTVLALWPTVLLGRRDLPASREPLAWLAVLILATLRSPFLPQSYGVFPALWLLTLIAATHAPSARTLSLTVLVWAGLNAFLPNDSGVDPRWLALLITIPQLLTVALALWVLRERPSADPILKMPLGLRASPAAP